MGTGASVPPRSLEVLDAEQAQRLAGPIWRQATFDAHATDHNVDGNVVRGIARDHYIDLVSDAVATKLGVSKRDGPFWDRVNTLYLYMDSAVQGKADGVVTLEELKVDLRTSGGD